jgi:hypothetical protein
LVHKHGGNIMTKIVMNHQFVWGLKGAALLLGTLLLLGVWTVLYWSEMLFTESHLVGYYCCVTEQDLPAAGTLARALSDFFRGSVGQHLPSALFIALSAGLTLKGMIRTEQRVQALFLFALLGILFLGASLALVTLSWSISAWLVGPFTDAYKGYDRTWYGIVLHFLLWGVYFLAMTRVSSAKSY